MLKRTCVLLPFLGLILSLYFCSSPKQETKPVTYASLDTTTTYVGMATCAGCHRNVYDTYIHTGMGLSFDTASKTKSAARFGKDALVRDNFQHLDYHPYWSGEQLMLHEFRTKNGDTSYSQQVPVSYIIGSGQHTNSHMVNFNGYVYQAPATFYTQRAIWDLPPGFENGHNSRFGRKIELECMSCHNAYPQLVEGSENKYTLVPKGIDCERCHGPGSKHVAEKRSGNIVDTSVAIDYSIVNPAKLGIDRQLDVCQRCHIQGNAVLAEGKSFYDFRPAMKLSDVMNVFMPVYKGQEDEHIMASHAERLKMSPCFLVSAQHAEQQNQQHPLLRPYQNAMTCVTCHNPHVSVKVTGNDVFNNACRNCHGTAGVSLGKSSGDCSASLAARQKLNDNCVTCHMPKNSTIDIPHVSTTDHYIHKPVAPATVQKIREFIGLACINNKSPDDLTKGNAYLNYYEKFDHRRPWLDSAKKFLRDGTGEELKKNFKSLVRWAYLAQDYKQVVDYANRAGQTTQVKSYSNEDAWTAYRIGEAFAQLDMKVQSMQEYEKAVRLAPYVPEFRNKLGSMQVENQRLAEAKENFRFLVTENPDYAPGFINLGYLLLSTDHDIVAADRLYDRALSLEPDNEQALLNKAGAQVLLQHPEEARKLLEQLLKVNPQHPTAGKLLHALRSSS